MSADSEELSLTDEEWRKRLSTEQYAVLRQAATERPFSGEYVDTDEDGLYHCRSLTAFDSRAKYHSGTGWPSFTETVSPEAVELVEDSSHGMVRTEVPLRALPLAPRARLRRWSEGGWGAAVVHEQRCARPGRALRLDRELTLRLRGSRGSSQRPLERTSPLPGLSPNSQRRSCPLVKWQITH